MEEPSWNATHRRKAHRFRPLPRQLQQRRHARDIRKVFGFRKFFEMFVGSETCLDLFGLVRPFRMRSDKFGCALKRSEALGRFRNLRKLFALVPNTGEANDEMCAPSVLIISEMCALRLENNNRLRL